MACGIASLRNDEINRANCRIIEENREYSVNELKKLGFEMTDSTANFIFVKHPDVGGSEIFTKLRERGVVVRHFDKPEISDYNRITIGTREQMDILLRELRDIIRQ